MGRISRLMMIMSSLLLIMIIICSGGVHGVNHVVGGSKGWAFGVDYEAWAKGKIFTVGDTLEFNSEGTYFNSRPTFEDVSEVEINGYYACNSGNRISRSSGSPGFIKLTNAGKNYFISDDTSQCNAGMKLAINVCSIGVDVGGTAQVCVGV